MWTGVDAIVLQNIDLAIKYDSLTMIIGPIGCGVSTMIKTILEETKLKKGIIDVSCKKVASCDQSISMADVRYDTGKHHGTG